MLFEITKQQINQETVDTVSARELHKFLESNQEFANWIKNRIEKYGFTENVDFLINLSKTPSGGRPSIEYHITLDMAKELAMIENNPKGREARQYFIECEKQQAEALKALSTVTLDLPNNPITFKNGDFYLSSLHIAKHTGKRHDNVLRDIDDEITQLNLELHKPENGNPLKSEDIKKVITAITNGVKEVSYLDSRGRVQKAYDLTEEASYQILLRYSPIIRAIFIYQFKAMRDAIVNMFKLKLIDNVLPERKGKRQYVYIIKNLGSGNVKIGVGSNPAKRLAQLQTGSDVELALVYTSFICSNAFDIEHNIHEYFKKYHVRGEWFKIPETTVIQHLENSKFVLSSDLDLSFSTKLKTLISEVN